MKREKEISSLRVQPITNRLNILTIRQWRIKIRVQVGAGIVRTS